MANASNLLLDLTTELLSQGTTVRFRPSGRSMYPSIREGELITVEPVVARDVKPGDIVLYRSERGLLAHRVVGSSPTQSSVLSPHHFLLRGDASLCCDKPVAAQQILGRVVGVKRRGRSVALASRGAKMWHKVHAFVAGLRRALRRCLWPAAVSSQPGCEQGGLSYD